ncbi:unnamed protein product [Protopolystoma xenopodis]|uniref:RNA helicase n=1 Tax=Protopolystoma xenopodis TaxID=117903 RepID=A0A3S5A0H1_9PLAT|nr:unnamed protein product [Protopolystoma xenopodis]
MDESAKPDDDELDPLDAYMQSVHNEVRNLTETTRGPLNENSRFKNEPPEIHLPDNYSAENVSESVEEPNEILSVSITEENADIKKEEVVVPNTMGSDSSSIETLKADLHMTPLDTLKVLNSVLGKRRKAVPIGTKLVVRPHEKGELMESNIDELEYSSEEEEESIADTIANMQKKDKLLPIDHSKMNYAPFRRSFYVEVPEITRMTKEEVRNYRKSLEHIRIKGKNCPRPIKTWVQAGVSSKLLGCLKRSGFEKPTPIQCQALPVIMSGRDMIGIAKTGSGKTLAFLVPLLRHLEHQPPLEQGDGPVALLMTPTRELALQTYREAKRLSQEALAIHVVCVYGGTGISEQIAELKRGAEIIVCTPGRMIDMLAANGAS